VEAVPSPCSLVCTLDGDDICLGCGRTLGEITEWGGAANERRLIIVADASKRMKISRCSGDRA
jgi:predicted Fe-S protein YdhL (DUF1289 family)